MNKAPLPPASSEEPDWLQQLKRDLDAAASRNPTPQHPGPTTTHLDKAIEALAIVEATEAHEELDGELDYLEAFSLQWSASDVARHTAYPIAARRCLIAFMTTYRERKAELLLNEAKRDRAEANRILDATLAPPTKEERNRAN